MQTKGQAEPQDKGPRGDDACVWLALASSPSFGGQHRSRWPASPPQLACTCTCCGAAAGIFRVGTHVTPPGCRERFRLHPLFLVKLSAQFRCLPTLKGSDGSQSPFDGHSLQRKYRNPGVVSVTLSLEAKGKVFLRKTAKRGRSKELLRGCGFLFHLVGDGYYESVSFSLLRKRWLKSSKFGLRPCLLSTFISGLASEYTQVHHTRAHEEVYARATPAAYTAPVERSIVRRLYLQRLHSSAPPYTGQLVWKKSSRRDRPSTALLQSNGVYCVLPPS